jgi:hypothetical protein
LPRQSNVLDTETVTPGSVSSPFILILLLTFILRSLIPCPTHFPYNYLKSIVNVTNVSKRGGSRRTIRTLRRFLSNGGGNLKDTEPQSENCGQTTSRKCSGTPRNLRVAIANQNNWYYNKSGRCAQTKRCKCSATTHNSSPQR